MANFNKSFNFRGGFQVDESVFVVRGQTVGIGSSTPTQRLDVDGIVKAKGLEITSEQSVGIESASVGFLSATTINCGVASISAGVISATSAAGIVTYYGDGRFLEGLPTSQWIDVDVGLGYTSIYSAGNVGVDTNDPRYAFQVGGVPFPTFVGPALPAQDGVAIQDGNILVSGIVSTRGEFIGLGSNITAIDGSNITVGAIGSMAYGSLIVTEEVIADRFTGIASTAVNVLPTSQLVFDTARANEITAVNRFISTEGFLQIGNPETVFNNGDIEVNKGFDNASILGISTNAGASVYVGQQRPGGAAIQYGGLRKGVLPGTISGPTDLDIVNADEGNINFYLHDGPTGTTNGSYRWINGQTDSILAELSQIGNFILNGNFVNTDPILDVTGTTSLNGKVSIIGGMNVSGLSSYQDNVEFLSDITVTGDTTFNGTVNLNGNIGIASLLIGLDPNQGGSGTLIEESAAYIAGVAQFNSSGIDCEVNVTAPIFFGDLNSSNIAFTGNLTGNSNLFSVDSTGQIVGSSIQVSTGTIDSINATTLSVTSTSTLANINSNGTITANLVDVGTVQALTASISGTVSAGDLNVSGSVSVADLTSATISAGIGTISTLEVDTITSTVNVQQTLFVGNNLNVTGNISGQNISASDTVSAVNGNFSNLVVDNDGSTMSVGIRTSGNEVVFSFNESNGDPIGQVTLPFDP